MRVVAMQMGFFGGTRRRVGEVFEMPDAEAKATKWVEPVVDDAEAKRKAAAAKKADEEKFVAGAIAASGGAAARAKTRATDDIIG